MIGTLLGMSRGVLETIEATYPTNVKRCCNKMLEKWLQMSVNPTWEELTTVINSPAVSSHQDVLKGNYAVLHTMIASYIVRMCSCTLLPEIIVLVCLSELLGLCI